MRSLPATTDRSPWPWAASGAATGLLLALVLFAPARWLAWAVEQGSDGRALLRSSSGTVWNGSAQLVLTGGAGSQDSLALPSRLQWQLQASWSGVNLLLSAACCTDQPIAVAVTPHWGGAGVHVQDSQSHWPASLLTGLGTPWNTLQPQGQLDLQTQGLDVDVAQGRSVLSGQARLELRQVSSALSTVRPMGNYRLTLNGGASASLLLKTLPDSPLQLAGTGRWVDSRLHFEGTATAQPQYQDALSNLLNIIGRRDGARSIIQLG